MTRYARFREYVDSKGTARVPYIYRTRDRFQLGVWVSKQRRLHRGKKLPPRKVKLLKDLPGWIWNPVHAALPRGAWTRGLKRLREFVERNGTSRMPARYSTRDGFRLGLWAHRQRGFFRQKKLALDKVLTLKALPEWDWNPPRHGIVTRHLEVLWERNHNYLREYFDKNGTSRVPPSYMRPDGIRLGVWVQKQRQDYKRKRIGPIRVRALENFPDWDWHPGRPGPRLAPWTCGLSHLQQFVKKRWTSRVPASYKASDGFRLGAWVASQRVLYRSKKLSRDRISALEALPRWEWNPSLRRRAAKPYKRP